jgi:hypothetical protein
VLRPYLNGFTGFVHQHGVWTDAIAAVGELLVLIAVAASRWPAGAGLFPAGVRATSPQRAVARSMPQAAVGAVERTFPTDEGDELRLVRPGPMSPSGRTNSTGGEARTSATAVAETGIP